VKNIIEFLMGIVVGNSNKLQKGVWKENSIECIQLGPMTYGTLIFNQFLS
jgi:hypothetical protein